MRNLKRALSLVMAMALIVGMMVISASAVSVKDFTDSDEIDHNEAVNTMVALNVIDGKEDGSYFDPTGTLTRAEMAKIVAYVMNGGTEPNIGTKVIPTYSDIDNHWAEAYIEYCTSMGIIAGDGAGKFNPTGTLTAEQTAKMFLTAMGYNAEVFGLVGNDWAMNVGRYANEAGLYKGLEDLRVSGPISRDDACQMAYNAIQAAIMERSWSQDITTGTITEGYDLALSDEGKPTRTLFSERFGGVIYEGVLMGSGYMHIGSRAGADKLRMYVEYRNGVSGDYVGLRTLNYDVDCTDMLGEYVKVLYNETDKYAYGVYTVEDETTVVINTTLGALSDVGTPADTLTYDGTTYDIDQGVHAYIIGKDTTPTSVALTTVDTETTLANYDNIKLVDNDGDGILDAAYVIANTIAEVTYVGSDSITLTSVGSVRSVDAIYSDLAVGDIVSYVGKGANFENKAVVTEAELVSGTVNEVGYNTSSKVNRVLVDGTWYTLGQFNGANPITDDLNAELAYNTSYDMAIYNGYLVDADKLAGGNSKLAVITGVTSVTDYDGNTKVRLLLADGSTVEGFADLTNVADVTTDSKIGALISYVLKDGIYVAVDASSAVLPAGSSDPDPKAGYDNYGYGDGIDVFDPAAAGGKVLDGTYKIDKDAVVFVQYDSDLTTPDMQEAFRVTNGDEINSWKSKYGTDYEVLWNNSGLGFAGVVYITGAADVATPGVVNNYGYITSAITEGSDASGVYSAFTIWDGSDTLSVIVRSNSVGAGKGDVITFDWDGESVIKNIEKVTGQAALVYSNGVQVRLNDTGYSLADDVVIINVSTKDAAGVGGNAISTAAQTKVPGVYFYNCWYEITDNEITLLVIDVTDSKLSGVDTGWNNTSGDIIPDISGPAYQ